MIGGRVLGWAPGADATATVVGPPRPALRCISAAGFLVFLWICVAVPISDRGGFASFPGYMLFLATMGVANCAVGTSRIVVAGDQLHLVNLATVRSIRRRAIDHADGSNGVLVIARDGREFGSIAYGSSLLQCFWHSRRYARAARGINAWVRAGDPADSEGTCGLEGSAAHLDLAAARSLRPRRLLTRGLPLAIVVAQLFGVLLWQLSPVLRPLIEGVGR